MSLPRTHEEVTRRWHCCLPIPVGRGIPDGKAGQHRGVLSHNRSLRGPRKQHVGGGHALWGGRKCHRCGEAGLCGEGGEGAGPTGCRPPGPPHRSRSSAASQPHLPRGRSSQPAVPCPSSPVPHGKEGTGNRGPGSGSGVDYGAQPGGTDGGNGRPDGGCVRCDRYRGAPGMGRGIWAEGFAGMGGLQGTRGTS